MKNRIMGKAFFSVYALLSFIFMSCMQIVDERSVSSGGKGTVVISFNSNSSDSASDSARTILPGTNYNEYALSSASGIEELFTDIKFYCNPYSSSDDVFGDSFLAAQWSSYESMTDQGASIELDSGTYAFGIELTSFGTVMRQSGTATVTSGTSKTLNFSNLKAYSGTTGAVSILFYFTSQKPYVDTYGNGTAVTVKTLSGDEIITDNPSSYNSYAEDSNGGILSVVKGGGYYMWYRDYSVEEGYYEVTLSYTDSDGVDIYYPVGVQVKAGYMSYDSVSFSGKSVSLDDKTAYTVTYMANTSDSDTSSVKKTVYSGSSFYLGESSLGFSNDDKKIKYWTTNKDGSGEQYEIGDVILVTDESQTEITLYAHWATLYNVNYVIEYYNGSKKSFIYTQKYENGVENILALDEIDFTKTSFYHPVVTNDRISFTEDYFCGWDTKSDGSGTRYYHNSTSQPSTAIDQPELTEDIILYAQWVHSYADYNTNGYRTFRNVNYNYSVSNVSQWNALFGAPWKNPLTKNILIQGNIKNPHEEFTKTEEFTGAILGYSILGYSKLKITGLTEPLFNTNSGSVKELTLDAPVFNTNSGTIESVTVSGYTTSSNTDGDIGGIAGINGEGASITDCSVTSMTVQTAASRAGGIAGTNSGTITDCTVNGVTFSALATYTGGLVGMNGDGAIIEKSETTTTTADVRNVKFTGDTTDKNYGYVFGGMSSEDWAGTDSGVSTEITTDVQGYASGTDGTELNTLSYSCKCGSSSTENLATITLARTSLVTLKVTPDNDAWYIGIMKSSGENPYKVAPVVGNTSKGGTSEVTVSAYLPVGTYYLNISEARLFGAATGAYTVIID